MKVVNITPPTTGPRVVRAVDLRPWPFKEGSIRVNRFITSSGGLYGYDDAHHYTLNREESILVEFEDGTYGSAASEDHITLYTRKGVVR